MPYDDSLFFNPAIFEGSWGYRRMRNNSILVLAIALMATVLVAGRCSDEEVNAPAADESSVSEDSSADQMTNPDEQSDAVDSGVEADPLGGTIGGDDTMPSVEDPAEVPADDVGTDESSFEPEPIPEEASDL